MDQFNLEALKRIAPPPAKSKGAGTPHEWSALERKLNLKFPEDFTALVDLYGAGSFNGFFGAVSPFYASPTYTPYLEWIRLKLDGIELAKSNYSEEAIPFSTHPHVGGLFPWGYTDNGGTMCWRTIKGAKRWPIVCLDDACSSSYDEFDLSICEFIERWLAGSISVPSLTPPDFYPLRRPVFRPT